MARKYRTDASTAEVRAALKLRFAKPAFAFFEEVGNSTGGACRRHADCVAMSLWPSRGLHINGIEIKASRQDWLKELADPEKADEIARFCDFWWLAIGDEKIVQAGELPANWGLLVMAGDKLVCTTEAKLLEPQPLSRGFVGSLLRRAQDAADALLSEAEERGFKRGVENGPEHRTREQKHRDDELEGLKKALAEFQEKSGIQIHQWNGGDIGEAVKKLMRSYEIDPIQQLEQAAQSLEYARERILERAKDLRAAGNKMPKRPEAAE